MFHLPDIDHSNPPSGALQSCSELHETRHISRQESIDARNHLLVTTISNTVKSIQESNTKYWKDYFRRITEDQRELEAQVARRRHRA